MMDNETLDIEAMRKHIERLDAYAVPDTDFGKAVSIAKMLLIAVHRIGAELEHEQQDNERLRDALATHEQVREGILADMQARYVRLPNINGGIAPAVNPAAGQDGE